MSRQIKVIVIALAATMVLLAVGAAAVIPRLAGRQLTVTAEFEDAIGLYAGNAVAVLGIPVGTVTGVVSKDSYVAVTLAIDEGVDIPADVQAVTVSHSILTDRVVELTPPYRGGPKLHNGDVLGLARTRTPVEFDRTLAMVDKLGKALHGDANGNGPLGDLVSLGAEITSQNGPQVRATLDKLSQALRVGPDKGAHSKKNMQAIITSVAELSQSAADNDAAIREFGSNLRQLSDILADEDLGSGSTGAKVNEILAEATRLLEGNRATLNGTFAGTRTITTSLVDYRRELAEILDVGPLAADNLYNVIDENAGSVRAHLLVDKMLLNGQFAKEVCNLMGLKQLGCATGTLNDYGPDFGLTGMLNLMADGISGTP
ncbi:MCE family protein [Mycobacterium sp. pUA109]|uniref:MCE family protein n=1 Tax=Mycobacterium sp. pUA109 TaxID=3238982 RepID=UPI00351BA4ED